MSCSPGAAVSKRKNLFVFGSPRSGTTWIQLLLDQHEAVVTAPETQIFSFYLSRFRSQWQEEINGEQHNAQGGGGLSQLLNEEEFRQLCRLNASFVLDRIAARDPEATVVVEKSPMHAVHAGFIHSIFPEAYFLHVLRDPRDTVASLLSAGRSWGRHWAPSHPVDAARMWRRHVVKGREIAGTEARYMEVRYEHLKRQPEQTLGGVLSWLGLSADEHDVARFVEACRLQRLQKTEEKSAANWPMPSRKVPAGFFRKGEVGGWRSDLTAAEARIVEAIAGSIMEDAGYERQMNGGTRATARIRLHDTLSRVRESVDWQLQRLLRKV